MVPAINNLHIVLQTEVRRSSESNSIKGNTLTVRKPAMRTDVTGPTVSTENPTNLKMGALFAAFCIRMSAFLPF